MVKKSEEIPLSSPGSESLRIEANSASFASGHSWHRPQPWKPSFPFREDFTNHRLALGRFQSPSPIAVSGFMLPGVSSLKQTPQTQSAQAELRICICKPTLVLIHRPLRNQAGCRSHVSRWEPMSSVDGASEQRAGSFSFIDLSTPQI